MSDEAADVPEMSGLASLVVQGLSEAPLNVGVYPMWQSYEEGSHTLTAEALESAIRQVMLQQREPYIEIVSYAEYQRRKSAMLTRMSTFSKFIARAKVVFTAAPTYLIAASAIVVIVSSEAATVLPAGAATTVAAVSLKVVAVLTAAINVIRRVTPVLPSERGLL